MASQMLAKPKGAKLRRRHGSKLPALPSNAQVTKRPLLRPPIVSCYANGDQPKTVYVSTRTPFLSAVKRVEKLLHMAEKRLVQSATTVAKAKPYQQNKRARLTQGLEAVDEIGNIVRTAEEMKDKRGSEEIRVKGTGKAIPKVMEMGVWFQQRKEYKVVVHTGTVSGIDDVEYEEELPLERADQAESHTVMDHTSSKPDCSRTMKRETTKTSAGGTVVSETRIRKMSMLELRVCLR